VKPDDENTSAIDTPHSALKELQTANSKLQTEQMEVHHHPRLDHSPKPWKEYLLEGLMIFLAVTMGFFAESLREHITDRSKEKQIIAALQKDLKKDTAALDNDINVYAPKHNAWVDSANIYINTLPLKGNERKITRAVMNATSWQTYTPPEVALDMLKNTGTFNLIENNKVKAEILIYDGIINEYIKYSAFVAGVEHSADTASTSFMSRETLRNMIAKLYVSQAKHTNGFVDDNAIPENIKFKSYNKAAFVNFSNELDHVDELLSDMLGSYRKILAEEIKLLQVLKEEYDIEDE